MTILQAITNSNSSGIPIFDEKEFLKELLPEKRIYRTAKTVFNPNFLEITTFIDCHRRRNYLVVGRKIEFRVPPQLDLVEPKSRDYLVL